MLQNVFACIWQLSSCAATHEYCVCVYCVYWHAVFNGWWLSLKCDMFSAHPAPLSLTDRVHATVKMHWLMAHLRTNAASHFEDDSTHIFTLSKHGRNSRSGSHTHTSHFTVLIHRRETASKLHWTTARQMLSQRHMTKVVVRVTAFHVIYNIVSWKVHLTKYLHIFL